MLAESLYLKTQLHRELVPRVNGRTHPTYNICMYVYCTCNAPICHANGRWKTSFAWIVGADESEADYRQKAVLNNSVFNLVLKIVRHLADLMCRGRCFQTSSAALVKVRCPAVVPSPVGIVSWHFVAERSPGLPGLYADTSSARYGGIRWGNNFSHFLTVKQRCKKYLVYPLNCLQCLWLNCCQPWDSGLGGHIKGAHVQCRDVHWRSVAIVNDLCHPLKIKTINYLQ